MPPKNPRGFLTEEEKQSLPTVTWGLIRRILRYLAPYWARFLLVFATILLSAVLGLLPSIITGRIVDEALVGQNMTLLIQLLLMALVTLIASQLVSVLTTYLNAWISQHIIFDMKNQLYRHLQQMSHAFFTSERQGDIITRMNTDVSGVSSVISGTLSSILSNVATVITTLVAMFGMSDEFGMMALASRRSQYLDGGYGMDCAQDTAARMDKAVKEILDKCYADAVQILKDNREDMDKVVAYLLEKETITGGEMVAIIEGRDPELVDNYGLNKNPQHQFRPSTPDVIEPPAKHINIVSEPIPMPETVVESEAAPETPAENEEKSE